MSDSKSTNGTADVVNRVEDKITKPAESRVRKSKDTKFGKFWDLARAKGTKPQIRGTIHTVEADLNVRLNSFPVTLEDEAFQQAARSADIEVSAGLEGREVSGVLLKNGRVKFQGDAAVEFLVEMAERANES